MNIIKELDKLKRKHYTCEDYWYSCPKSEEGCGNPDDGDDCNCGADKYNKKIDDIVDFLVTIKDF